MKTPERISEISLSEQRILDQGREIGIKAHDYFRDGSLVDTLNFEDAVKQTQEFIQNGAPCIFEGAFAFENIRLRCDVLEREPDGSWKLMEVKSSTKVKDEHLHDAAFQYYVLSEAGMPISKIELMHINSDCVYPDLTNLFVSEDITTPVNQLKDDVGYYVKSFITMVRQGEEPEVPIGKHCSKPNSCPFMDYCWQDVPKYSIFTIPRISAHKVTDLVSEGTISIFDLPPDYPLNSTQRSYVSSVLSGKANIDKDAIAERLSEYAYPIYFLDFETFNPSIPRFVGLRPYQQFPFQYSCHVWDLDGTITHFEYLHTEKTDPRQPFVESLINLISERGSLVVYYAPFERMILRGLVQFAPEFSSILESMIARLEDQMEIFKNHYKHPGFLGSNSLKRVLPVLVPALTYEDLNVQGGSDAQAIWEQMILSTDGREKSRFADDLRAYCEMDTLAMVEIHKALHQL